MPVTHGMTIACKHDLLCGLHQPGDTYMVALYNRDAAIGAHTEVYSPVGEVKGKGYVAGGKPLKGHRVEVEGTRAKVCWDSPVRWPNATIKARHALIYNKSKGDRALTILDLGEEAASTNGNWDLLLPDCVLWIG